MIKRIFRFVFAGVEYSWNGGSGAILKSYEYGMKVGEVRMIGGVPFFVHMINGFWPRKEISWTIPYDHLTMEWIRAFKQAIFMV